MLSKAVFLALLLLSCGYSAWAGGRSGRVGAVLVLAAAFATIPASRTNPEWVGHATAVFIVDALLLVGLIALSMRSKRYWPLWAAGFHLNALIPHIAVLIGFEGLPKIYQSLESVWSLPVLLVMPLGIMLDNRRPKKSFATHAKL